MNQSNQIQGRSNLSLGSVIEKLDKAFVFFAGFLLVTMMLMICANVFIRFFLGYSLAWSIEISEYMLVYVSLLVAPWVLRNNAHISFDLFYANASPKAKKVCDIISHILGILVCAILTVFGFIETWEHYVGDVLLYNTILMPKFILLLVIPVSGALMLLEFIKRLISAMNPNRSSSNEETV